MKNTVDIRPEVSILSVLKHLNYSPWHALAEYVDNSIGSFFDVREKLKEVHKDYVLEIKIDIDSSERKITIKDNAGGIAKKDFPRAFRTAEIPPDSKAGLSEFGMGMKSASCWFTNEWEVRTKSFGDENEYEVKFNISEIVSNHTNNLHVNSRKVNKNSHYTIIELKKVHDIPVKRALGKIRNHLTSIYRQFFREGYIKIWLNGEELIYEEPKVLFAPAFNNQNGQPILWKKEFRINIDKSHSAKGFVALQEKLHGATAGFALFRRKRVIQDSGEEGYFPKSIFSLPNSFQYQRLFGEIFLEGFGVSHTKDAIQWEGLEEQFLLKLKENMKNSPDLYNQAIKYRSKPKKEELIEVAKTSLERTSAVLERDGPETIQELREQMPESFSSIKNELEKTKDSIHKLLTIPFEDETWEVHLELSADETIIDLIDIGDRYVKNNDGAKKENTRKIGIRMSLQNPFLVQFIDSDEAILRMVVAIAISEIIAKDSGIKSSEYFRKNINKLLRVALFKRE